MDLLSIREELEELKINLEKNNLIMDNK